MQAAEIIIETQEQFNYVCKTFYNNSPFLFFKKVFKSDSQIGHFFAIVEDRIADYLIEEEYLLSLRKFKKDFCFAKNSLDKIIKAASEDSIEDWSAREPLLQKSVNLYCKIRGIEEPFKI